MGTNPGNGASQGQGGGDMSGMMQSNQANGPHATEYTLQGVMRFLQTEWHRHERDRNAWDIEKQEMKSRIAALEGAARRSDATQKALKKYVTILEQKVKQQAAQLKGENDATSDTQAPASEREKREALLKEHLEKTAAQGRGGNQNPDIPTETDVNRSELKTFLDQCQSEFTYLMITPANPIPPRESPPPPMLDELPPEAGSFGLPAGQQVLEQSYAHQPIRQTQNHVREINPRPAPSPALNHHVPPPMQPTAQTGVFAKGTEMQAAPVVRSSAEMQPLFGGAAQDWPPSNTIPPNRLPEENLAELNSQPKPSVRQPESTLENAEKRFGEGDGGWDFSEASFTEPQTQPQQPQQQIPPASNRPDTDVFPNADSIPKSPNRGPNNAHRRKSSMSRRRSSEQELSLNALAQKAESGSFKLRFGLRGHLNTVRTVIFSGGGSPGEPEICTAGDDGLIKRFHIPRLPHTSNSAASDLDVQADFTHRGHHGAVLSLAAWAPSPNFSTGGRAQGDGWIFSGGQDSMIRVWERGRVDPKASLDGHTDAVWALCVLPATLGAIFGNANPYGSPDRILLASGAADGTVRLWAVSAPPQMTSPQPPPPGRRVGGGSGRVRGNSMSSGSAFPSSPQPSVATNSPFHHTLIHSITRADSPGASPTCITTLGRNGEAFVVSYSDAAIIVYDTRTGEEMGCMASLETYDGTPKTSVNAVVATTVGLDQPQSGEDESGSGSGAGGSSGGPTGGGRSMAGSGVEGVIISGHEDQFVRFFDANSGQCTYNMLAHPASISSLSLSPNGQELVSAGHDASLRFWSLEKRSCTQEITSHRIMRGEGVCDVVWSSDGKWVVSGGGDGVVKVFAR
ncbi:striatin Pro11 [Pyricularia oryzae 70-15]|uniref:Striatin Pro11 n=1 Tax=Pyricularia oryzae (strain 70-15 / ATCC MYA-4617 / FGSC 8958) TaxID=242507 RepID=G4N0F8_PYRO7|nr:striatin Pro11 [Pyricularia oryzae 70-15]EHA52292.1 striatin Pro11 [Pyricularia oryzae 70-15]KAI7913459.1 striatin Pro11 [Pyricularia oryzae]KAI7914616.1 striatin Pro11 [Pyricularia oryzae]